MSLLNNKKGTTLSAWTEAILLILVVIGAFSWITVSMNKDYPSNNTVDLGINYSEQMQKISNYTNNAQNQTQVESTIFGLNLKSFGVVSAIFSIMIQILSGQWIPNLINSVFVGAGTGLQILGYALQAAFIASLIYAILRILFRGVNP